MRLLTENLQREVGGSGLTPWAHEGDNWSSHGRVGQPELWGGHTAHSGPAQLLLPLSSRHLPTWGPEAPPDSVTGATVAPAALHLLEPVDAALLAPQAAPGPVDELHPRLGVDSEVQEEADHLAIYQDARLCRACGQRKGRLRACPSNWDI